MTTHPLAKKVLLVGWDAADWNVINPLIDQGKMPNLEYLITNGVMGNLATLYPELSPMLWTSIATGKRPWKHGIYGFTEPMPNGKGVRPVTVLSRKTKAIWNILNQNGKRSNVIGWWPSHPAEPINGVMVSNHFQRAGQPVDQSWPVQPGTIHPERLVRNLADLRWHPQNLTAGHILPFVPRAGEVDQDKDRRLETIARIFCDCSSIHSAAVAIMHHEPWDFTAIYFDAIDHFSHAFMRYHPPRPDWVLKTDFETYNQVVQSGYIYHDMMLGKLLAEAGEETTVLVISDHGFHCDHRRPRQISSEPAGPAAEHRRYGILVAKGPGIRKDEIIYGAGLLDICPTILCLFGLPVGEDMDGVPLAGLFESASAISTIPGWDSVPGNSGMHPFGMQINPVENQQMLNQLIDLGYIEKPAARVETAVSQCTRELDYNLARSYMDAGRHVQAISLLQGLFRQYPDQYRFGIALVNCLKAVDRVPEARECLQEIIDSKLALAATASKQLRNLIDHHGIKRQEDQDEKDREKFRKLKSEATVNMPFLDYLMGSLLASESRLPEALEHFRRAETRGYEQPELYLQMGDTLLCMNLPRQAESTFRQALTKDPDNAQAFLGLGRVFLALKQNHAAVDHILSAIGLEYLFPMAHFCLGVGLHRLGRIPEAVQALETAVAQNPNFPLALNRLAYIHKHRLNSGEDYQEYRQKARDASRRLKQLKSPDTESALFMNTNVESAPPPRFDVSSHPDGWDIPDPASDLSNTVIIVSGLPRSGTSMMMQMLEAGGIRSMTDHVREPDPGNPKGYYEYEKVKSIARDSSWLSQAKGRAVKIVTPLLTHLKPGINYRVIVMERDMREVVRSQMRMLSRTGKKGSGLSESRLEVVFTKQMSSLKKNLTLLNISVLYVDYQNCIQDTDGVAEEVNRFLGGTWNVMAMAGAVLPDLYRERVNQNE
ncbi:MAG: alkaline phosphatase family protein [Pseudomonadota bacterium]